jgi:hypothetical protein
MTAHLETTLLAYHALQETEPVPKVLAVWIDRLYGIGSSAGPMLIWAQMQTPACKRAITKTLCVGQTQSNT